MAVNYLTLRSTMLYNTPGGASIPAGYINVASTGGNTLWTNNAALNNTTFSTLTGSTITSVSSVGIGKTNPVSLLDVAGIATATQVNLSGITAGDAGLQSELTNILNLNNNFRGTTITANPGIAVRLDGRSGENPFQFRYRAGGSATSTDFMVIDSTGRVGIGTGAPGYVLDLYGSNPTLRIRTSATAYTSGTATVLFESITGNYPFAKIVGEDTGVSPSVYRGDLVFYTQYNTVLSERMRIRNDGYITIPGTISLGGNPLNNNGINLPVGGWGIHWGAGYSRIVDDGDLRICTDDNMHFNTGSNNTSLGTERMIILSSGNVGIGTSIPRCKLYVQGTETTGWAGMSYFGGTSFGFVCGQYDTNNVYAGAHNAVLGAWGNLILCAGGNCGIGVAPSYKLHVSGNSYFAGEVYGTSWFRVVGGGGLYWESYGRGIFSADSAGASYGNVSTYGTGIGNWNGYDINGRYTFMANGNTVGVHDVNNSWVWNNVNTLMTINKTLYCNNYVGIGITNPSAPLVVTSYAYLPNAANNIRIISNAQPLYGANGGSWNVSILASSGIVSNDYVMAGAGFATASDIRIKKNIKSLSNIGIDSINKLNVVSYDYIDVTKSSVGAGLIAQELQHILPEAVNKMKKFIPNIYSYGDPIPIDDSHILITMPEYQGDFQALCTASRIELNILKIDNKLVTFYQDIFKITKTSITVTKWNDYHETDLVFIHGTEVDDFLFIDEGMVSMLHVKATQELTSKVTEQDQKIESLTAEVSDLKEKLALVMAKLGM